MEIRDAIQLVIDECKNGYAVAYARRSLGMRVGSEAFRTQLLYIKSNLVYWRHPQAKAVREAISAELGR